MKLDFVASSKYLFPIENDVVHNECKFYSVFQIVNNEKINITKKHDNKNGTFDLYAIVENGGYYIFIKGVDKRYFNVFNGEVTPVNIHG